MLRMSRIEDLSTQHPAPVEGRLAIQAGHSAHPRVFLKGLVVSPVVIRSGVRQRVVRLEAFPVGIPPAAASPGEAEAFMGAEAVLVASMVAVSPVGAEATVVAAVDNRTGCKEFC